jgi:hypothetical protein
MPGHHAVAAVKAGCKCRAFKENCRAGLPEDYRPICLILRSDAKSAFTRVFDALWRRVSKDEAESGASPFETPAFADATAGSSG